MTDELTEGMALAQWCEQLPSLRTHAAAAGVLDRLERDAARLQAGGSARQLVRKWLGEQSTSPRIWSTQVDFPMAAIPGPARRLPIGTGRYVCPVGRCGRLSMRDADGHPPSCTAFDTPMRPDH